MSVFTFFANQTTDTTSEAYQVQDGGYRIIKATGTFGGATITIEIDFADNDFAPIQAYQFTEADVKEIQPLKPGIMIRAVVTDATETTDVTLRLI